ncbi:MAG: transcriptional regulator GcvA [Marinicaulis sp.]|nr:transcriptional regulator GcvA [Marinicaulis sp.]NNE42129.1 transcriptional regulator GcvA [Marinicaulis sp.]NNL90542.1 transcriptional regulator GcvA [Marinicaulis sp.]
MKRLPPLNALRVFEAAARHLSFTKAAEELHVTPGAVSQQIKSLEDFLQTPVFRREKRSLLLTDEAQASLPVLRDGFDKLAAAGELLSARADSCRLTVSVAPSFASKWLVPRLDEFQEANPDVDVWVSADMNVVDFAANDVDIAIRYGTGNYEGLVSQHLLDEKIIPVCAPSLLTSDNPLKAPADLIHHTLLHDSGVDKDESCPTWPMWLKAAGVCHKQGERGLKFNQSSLVIEAAVAGKGVALAKAALALADLEAGRLVIPFDLTTPTDFSYYIVHPPSKSSSKTVKAFSAWLMAEAAATHNATTAQEAAA